MRECKRTLNHGCESSSNDSPASARVHPHFKSWIWVLIKWLLQGCPRTRSTTRAHDSACHGFATTAAGPSSCHVTIRHDSPFGLLTTSASGPWRSLEHMLVLFSLMADRSDRVSLLPQVGHRFTTVRSQVSSSPRGTAEPRLSSIRRRLPLCHGLRAHPYGRVSTLPRLRFDHDFVLWAPRVDNLGALHQDKVFFSYWFSVVKEWVGGGS